MKTQRQQTRNSNKAMYQTDNADLKSIEKELIMVSSPVTGSDIMKKYIQENPGVPLHDLQRREVILLDVSEAVGKFLVVNADVAVLRVAEQRALHAHAEDTANCVEYYNQCLKQVQQHAITDFMLFKPGMVGLNERLQFAHNCATVAAFHQVIFDQPMRIFRGDDIHATIRGGKDRRDTGKKPAQVRKPIPDHNVSESDVDNPMCVLHRDGSLVCTLSSDMFLVDRMRLDLSSLFRVRSRVSIIQSNLDEYIRHYEQLLSRDKKRLQDEHRTVYKECMDFINDCRNTTITAEQWRRFQQDCTKLVAMRKVLYNKDIPYEKLEDPAEPFATMKLNSELTTSGANGTARKDNHDDRSSSRQTVPADRRNIGHVRNDVLCSGGLVCNAKAGELHGKRCLLGDDKTQLAKKSFGDAGNEPNITVSLKNIVGADYICVTTSNHLAELLNEARERCSRGYQGAQRICDHLLKVCTEQNAVQLIDLIKIGCNDTRKRFKKVVEDCMQHFVLKCVLEDTPMPIMNDEEIRASIGKAHVVVVIKSSQDYVFHIMR